MPTLFLDLDGVLADFEGYVKKHIKHPWRDYHGTWKQISEIRNFYLHLPVLPKAKQLVYDVEVWCADNAYSIEILTALPRQDTMPTAANDKRLWVKKHFPKYGNVVNTCNGADGKARHITNSKDILIDDNAKNIAVWNKKAIGILYTGQSIIDSLNTL